MTKLIMPDTNAASPRYSYQADQHVHIITRQQDVDPFALFHS